METLTAMLTPVATNRADRKPRTVSIAYWTLTALFSLLMLMDGVAGVVQEETGQQVMRHLGYPIYAMIIFGVAKILGAIALLQPTFKTIKEWAYAGFSVNFIGAFASRAFVGDETALLIPPVIMLTVLFLTYFVWKRYEQVKTT